MAHEYAVRLALIAFAMAVAHGLLTKAAFQPALKLGLAAMAVSYVLGWFCGEAARRIVVESLLAESRSKARPSLPSSTPQSPGR